MPQFSNISLNRLELCHEDLQVLFKRIVNDFDCSVVSGYRTKEEQNEKVRLGYSKVGYPSSHNTKPSIAVDVAPFLNGTISWDEKDAIYFAGWVMSRADLLFQQGIIKHKIKCGADWDNDHEIKDTKFMDANHFELILSEEEKKNLKYYEK